ncbi:gp53-like domain-containing protein [Klebsiella pneumoniae]|uniref:gp53-like domain-containing protein n=2 Tax=Enterobacterales TaxID=91347 RepID=UPI0025A2C08D|nr:tail fiber protein [Klebsiella pneumoniae]MDM7125547.1 tail fiber protein [Klebsiella pneumoniae]MDM7136540.1 tail fiber protein [Klebsiella pneumoniae]MDM7195062.1 tail fiber protein [Klebsiella pneumoniae]
MSSDSVVISSVAFPDPATLALVADVQYHEPYTSAALNRKLRGILREGFYSGFIPRAGGGLNLLITSVNAEDNTGSASVNIGDDYQITIRQQKDIALQLSAGTKFAIVLKGVYTLGSDTYQVNTGSNIQAAEITAKTYTDDYQLGNGELLICTVNVPAGATELTEDMIDSTGKKIATVGIELSNDYESEEEKKAATPKAVKDGIAAHEAKPDPHQQYMESKNNLSEIADAGAAAIAEAQKNIGLEFSDSYESDDQTKAATPKAVKDGIANHEQKDNPHDQYLMIANCLKEIADKGDAAIQKVLDNLRLGEAAKRGVGNGANQLPDMSNFAGSLGFNGYQKLPTGLIIQWGALNVNGTSGAVGTTDISFPIAFPTAFRHLSALMSTNDPSMRFTGFDIGNTTTTKVRFTYVTPTSNSIYWMAIGY